MAEHPLALAGPFCPWIRLAGTWERPKPWGLPVRRLTDWLLVHCADGEEAISIDGRAWTIADGDTYLVQPGQLIEKRSPGGNRPTTVHFDLLWHPRRASAPPAPHNVTVLGERKAWLQPAARAVFGVDLPPVLPSSLRRLCARTIPALAERWRRGTASDVQMAQLRLSELLFALVEEVGGAPAIDDEARLARAIAFARDALDHELGADDLARAAGWATSRFYDRWRALRDDTPASFLRHERMELAQQLLSETELPIAEIAVRCGYPDPTVFGRVFRMACGASPRTWRRR